MALRLALLLLLLLPSGPLARSSAAPDEALVSSKLLAGLRGTASDAARLGLADTVEELEQLLLALGDEPGELAKFEEKWQRSLERAKPDTKGRALKSLVKKLGKQARGLEKALDATPAEDQAALAELVLQLDSSSAAAHLGLGHTLERGVWSSERARSWARGATRVEELMQAARRLEVPLEHGPSSLPAAVALYGEAAHQVTAAGVSLHGGIDGSKLERILRESLRAIALSKALLAQAEPAELELPHFKSPRQLLLLSADED